MNPLAAVVLSFVVVTGVTALAGLALLRWWPAFQRHRLTPPAIRGESVSILRWSPEPTAVWERTFERVGRAVAGDPAAAPSKYRERLTWAGYHNPRAVLLFIGAKVLLGVGLPAAYFVYSSLVLLRVVPMPRLLAMSLILGGIGFFLPDFWLRNRVTARQREIVHTLPDVLDLLTVCVEAGMGFDAAVARVVDQPEHRRNALHQELRRMHLEVRAGRPRAEAMRALGERTGVQEVRSLVGAFVQTDRLGTPLGRTLRIYADSARVQRRHRAEEQAHLAPLKMLFPTVFFLLPAFFLVTLAPSLLGVLRLMKTLEVHPR
ncbi:MAG TPA: type II secretion system F family protein [Candidatus Binatia bacterium]|nr:type II secretion system F family protein [Candidatus Binatia bacterium]